MILADEIGVEQMKTLTGLECLINDLGEQKKLLGNIGYLCHQASVDAQLNHGVILLKSLFKNRLKKIFSPQHGFEGDVQDNMVESDHFHHGHFNLPVYSLYSETRVPTPEMLEGLNHMIVDLQDVGTRIYTFIHTMTHVMEVCGELGIEVIILDRPNPIGCDQVEGNILHKDFLSFVGRHPLPTRHGLTIGEVALWAQRYCNISCDLRIVTMRGYQRDYYFEQTDLPWVPPSPNMPVVDSTFPFVGTVLFEGTSMSEGRGTTRPLEIIGHPQLNPWKHLKDIRKHTKHLSGFVLRPCHFLPTFQKHREINCGGFHIHVTDRAQFCPWQLAQILCQYFYHHIEDFAWKSPPYEYEYKRLPIDLINGTDRLRKWVEQKQELKELKIIEQDGQDDYGEQKKTIQLYLGH